MSKIKTRYIQLDSEIEELRAEIASNTVYVEKDLKRETIMHQSAGDRLYRFMSEGIQVKDPAEIDDEQYAYLFKCLDDAKQRCLAGQERLLKEITNFTAKHEDSIDGYIEKIRNWSDDFNSRRVQKIELLEQEKEHLCLKAYAKCLRKYPDLELLDEVTEIGIAATRDDLPRTSGIYFIMSDDCEDIKYIGRTVNLWQRLSKHHEHKALDNWIFYCQLPNDKALNNLEKLFIEHFRPLKNRTHNNEHIISKVQLTE